MIATTSRALLSGVSNTLKSHQLGLTTPLCGSLQRSKGSVALEESDLQRQLQVSSEGSNRSAIYSV